MEAAASSLFLSVQVDNGSTKHTANSIETSFLRTANVWFVVTLLRSIIDVWAMARLIKKSGVTQADVDRVCAAVAQVLGVPGAPAR